MSGSEKATVKGNKEKSHVGVELSAQAHKSSSISGVTTRNRKASTSTITSGSVTLTSTASAISSLSSPSLNAIGSVNEETSLVTSLDMLLQGLESRLRTAIVDAETRLTAKIDDVLSGLTLRLDALTTRLSELEDKYNKLSGENENQQRIVRLSDAVIRGIPELPNESPNKLLKELSTIVHHELSPYAEAFRIKRKTNKNKSTLTDRPIIVRFSCISERRAFFASLRKRSHIKLRELRGFSADNNIYINESLTPKNQHLLREALKFLKQKKLTSAYTANGIVHVKTNRGDSAIRITNLEQLTALFGSGLNVDAISEE